MNPRSFAAQLRRAIEVYTKATGVVPVVEFEGGERYTLRHPGTKATESDEGRNLQRELDGAFKQ
jgi:hypothetical protein